MEYTDFEREVYLLFNSEKGQYVLSELERIHVYTPIVQTDGEIASALRGGKSDLVRQLRGIWKKLDNKE